MYGEKPDPAELFVDDWQQCTTYLRGIDLFNHGYYWEAHEAWEALWHAAGRKGPIADFLKGLIKLAASGVKSLEGSSVGRARHARRAMELFGVAAASLIYEDNRFMGLMLDDLVSAAGNLIESPGRSNGDDAPFEFDVKLIPQRS